MKRYHALLFCAFISVVVCFSACTNSTAIGADLLESDRQNLIFTDDFVLKTSTVFADTVRTYSPFLSRQLTNYFVGQYEDPIFGKVHSSVYAQISTFGIGKPDFNGNTMDSVVLVLPYRTSDDYGNIDTEYTLDILRLDEDGGNEEELWSNVSFATEATPIGSKTFMPNITDDVIILSPDSDSIEFSPDTLAPQLRIRLEDNFAEELFNADVNMPLDSVFFSDEKFTDFFKGIHINATTENEGLLNFNLNNNASQTGIFVYYKIDNKSVVYQFPLSASDMKVAQYNHDYSGSIVESFVNDVDSGDSLFFVQGLAGVNGIIEFPDFSNLGDEITINKAELVLTVADELPEDLDIYELPLQLILEAKNEIDNYEFIYDVAGADQSAQLVPVALPSRFGGIITEFTDRPAEYSMNITSYVQDILKADAEPLLRLSPELQNGLANRIVFYGGQHSIYPAKLRIYYTQF